MKYSRRSIGNRMIYSCVWILCLIFIPGLCCSAYAEEILDLSDDLPAYCRTVAEINQAQTVTEYEFREECAKQLMVNEESVTVIGRAKQTPLAFTGTFYRPAYEIYGPSGFFTLIYSSRTSAIRAVSWLTEQEAVICAGLDAEVSGSSSGAEEVSLNSWGATEMHFPEYIQYIRQWGSSTVTVAVIDSGVYRHSLIDPKVNALGYDYVDADTDPTNDMNGHGTHVAGTIADCTRDVPVYIYPIRVLDENAKGKLSNLVSAVLEAVDAGTEIINLSLTSSMEADVLDETASFAISKGVTVVVAAGNEHSDTAGKALSGSMEPGMIVVGSAEKDGSISEYSNYGESVDVYTYGTDIASCSRSGGTVKMTGTSMATPHISALCGMLKLLHPSLLPAELETRIKSVRGAGKISLNTVGMIPDERGLYLNAVTLKTGDAFSLPRQARPFSAMERTTYVSADPAIVSVENDVMLTANSPGETSVTASCTGFADMVFTVKVEEGTFFTLRLPAGLTTLADEAFSGDTQIEQVILPEGLQTIGDDVFRGCDGLQTISIPTTVTAIGQNDFSGAVLLCGEEAFAYSFASENGLQYVITD